MPRVYRPRNESGSHISVANRKKRVPWGELDRAEIKTVLKKRLAALGVIGAAVFVSNPNGPVDSWGDLPPTLSESEQQLIAQQQVQEKMLHKTTAGKYALMFIQPELINVGNKGEGRGFLGAFSASDWNLKVTLGQDCLAGTAYDTLASSIKIRGYASGGGDISAVAALSVNGDEVKVHPAGSNAPALEFQLDDQQSLIPNDITRQTLAAYGCSDHLVTNEIFTNKQ